jgi:RND family efflux transporter MFP subunit
MSKAKGVIGSVGRFFTGIPRWMWRHKILSVILIVVIGVVASIAVNASKPPTYERATVKRGSIVSVVEASGKVKARKYADLAFTVPGKVVWVGAKKGDAVTAYQTVASMDTRETENAIRTKLLDYMKTRWDFEQGRQDADIKAPGDLAGLSDAERRIFEKSQFGLDQSVLAVELASLAKEQSQLVAPFAGTVVDDGNLIAGERLNATSMATKLFRIVDLSTLYFQANIDEADYAKVKEGQTVTINLDSYPDATVAGSVTFIGREGVKKTGGSVQIPVDIAMTAPPSGIVPELNGDIAIAVQRKDDILVLNRKYVHADKDGFSVNILRDGKMKKQPVTVGLSSPADYEITGGIADGDEVVNIATK